MLQQLSCRGDGAHVEDTNNPLEVQLPGRDRFFVGLCVVTSRDRIPSAPLGDVLLDLVYNPDPELGEETSRRTDR